MNDSATSSKHWRRTVDDDAVCWLTLDKADAAVNTLSSDVLAELERELDVLRTLRLRGVVFESGKRSGLHSWRGCQRVRRFARCCSCRGNGCTRPSVARPHRGTRGADGSCDRRVRTRWRNGARARLRLSNRRRVVRADPRLARSATRDPPGFRRVGTHRRDSRAAAGARSHVDGPVALPARGLQVRARRSSSRTRGAAEHGEGSRRSSPSSAARTVVLGIAEFAAASRLARRPSAC